MNTALGDEPLDSSEEQPRTVKGADHTIKTFGSFSYDASSGLTVSSSGSAYIKFPAIPDFKLSKVTIATSSTAPNPTTVTYPAYITPTYGTTNAEAIAAAVASTADLGRTGLTNPNVLTLTNPAANTAYYLFLPPQTGKTTGYQTMIMEFHLEYQPAS